MNNYFSALGVKRGLLASSLAATLIFTAGCWDVSQSTNTPGATAYADGQLVVTLPNHYDGVVSATEKSITQLQFAQPEERKDAVSASFVTHTATGDRVEIDETNLDNTNTKVSIKVGPVGNQDMSDTILEKIKSHL